MAAGRDRRPRAAAPALLLGLLLTASAASAGDPPTAPAAPRPTGSEGAAPEKAADAIGAALGRIDTLKKSGDLAGALAEAEKAIASKRSAAMENVRSIASEAAPAIVERLTGIVPASQDVAKAVADVLES